MAHELHQPLGNGGLPVFASAPRGCIHKLAYETDAFLVSQLAKLKPSDLKEASELVQDVAAFAATPAYKEYRGNPDCLFPAPGRIEVTRRWLAPYRIGLAEWSWPSVHPLIFNDIEQEYRSHEVNQTALLRTLNLRIEGKPMVILVNGFSSGHHLLERVAWPMRPFRRLGIGVSLFVLPFHGPRGRSFPPEWPQQDTKLTIEGFRQAIWDLQTAIRIMREAGASHVGVAGMSLGGYTVALLATAASDVDFVLSYIPIANSTRAIVICWCPSPPKAGSPWSNRSASRSFPANSTASPPCNTARVLRLTSEPSSSRFPARTCFNSGVLEHFARRWSASRKRACYRAAAEGDVALDVGGSVFRSPHTPFSQGARPRVNEWKIL